MIPKFEIGDTVVLKSDFAKRTPMTVLVDRELEHQPDNRTVAELLDGTPNTAEKVKIRLVSCLWHSSQREKKIDNFEPEILEKIS